MPSLVKVYIATSLDGFIAGENDDLSWLPQPKGDDAPDYGFHAFMQSVGALLLGRQSVSKAPRRVAREGRKQTIEGR